MGPVHALGIIAKTPEQWQTMAEQSNGEENIYVLSPENGRNPPPNEEGELVIRGP